MSQFWSWNPWRTLVVFLQFSCGHRSKYGISRDFMPWVLWVIYLLFGSSKITVTDFQFYFSCLLAVECWISYLLILFWALVSSSIKLRHIYIHLVMFTNMIIFHCHDNSLSECFWMVTFQADFWLTMCSISDHAIAECPHQNVHTKNIWGIKWMNIFIH